ncbi:D-alanyl-D-alanine carboxypeptidase/D-alanyl-D-alanine-endopeptidase [Cyanobium sp. ATX 6F1]|uniref:D-alanyl-D-alanine carboxypeptidase/D-alanyl-D-alanine endopeptidase n=1 Tax=Cyanobium sp. ATX 6F1 TaxID=2823702 RepID=UPI0039656E0D|nr:D-alanyl-D-alanine carboxypeptidase/D-alanyl-D-alanine-endopeptidase [Cyanobium sp. ATX 6F1]
MVTSPRPALLATLATALITLPAPPMRAQDQAIPLASLPPAPPPVGLPQLQSLASCPGLQQRLLATVGGESSVWSVTVADGGGRLLADLNGQRPRIPASNQKLISTAYALDRLGPDFRLKTQLWRLGDGTLRLTGSGDPDLGLSQLQRFAKLALGSGGSSSPAPSLVRLQLAEEPTPNWWPQGWQMGDRAEAYGAPITRLALTSNAIEMAIPNPVGRLQRLLQQEMARQGGKAVQISLVPAQASATGDMVLLHEEPSAPMHDLLSLANTESHNFTAEVLLRSASGTWNLATARQLEMQWLYQQGLPMAGVSVADGSGLDRANRVTSRLLAALLVRMAQHPYGANYQASMAIAGRRGTLRHLFIGTPIEGRFRGKTGTISGVRSISGVLDTVDGPRYVSMISNGASAPNTTIGRILTQVQNVSLCQPPA